MPNPYGPLTTYNRGQRYAGGGMAGDIASLGDTLAAAMWQIGEKRKQDRLDAIANDLIATMQAPKAQAVDGAPVAPPLSSDEERLHNAMLGFGYGQVKTPDRGGQAALSLLLDAKMKQGQIEKSFRGPVPKAGVVKPAPVMFPTAYGPMRPAQAAANDRAWTKENRIGSGGGTGRPGVDPTAAYADWLKKATGLNPTQLLNPNGWQQVDGAGKPSDTGDFYVSDVPGGDGDKSRTTLPADLFNQAKSRYLSARGGSAPAATGGGMSGHAIGSHEDNLAPSAATAPAAAGAPMAPSADAIRQQYRNGQLSKEEAAAQLRSLGFN